MKSQQNRIELVTRPGGEQVPGSPVTFAVEDKRSNELRVHGDGLKSGNVGDETVLIIEATHSEPSVKVRGPNSTPRIVLQREKNGTT